MAHMGAPCYCGCTAGASSAAHKQRYSPKAEPPHWLTSPKAKRKRAQARARKVTPTVDASPAARLMEFVKWNMTLKESEGLLRLLVQDRGMSYVPTPTHHKALREFLETYVSPNDAERYLRELERRKHVGEVLIRAAKRK
jgi:hypothetical protein